MKQYRGLTREKWRELIACGATRAYAFQRRNAKNRGIAWKLTLEEWWEIWKSSGKYEERGRNRGQYVMARVGDQGAYERGNVEIQTHSQNALTAQAHRIAEKRERGCVFLMYPAREKGWVARHRKTHLGFHASKEEADAAVLAYLGNMVETAGRAVGLPRVLRDGRGTKWRMYLYEGKKQVHLGMYETQQEAENARQALFLYVVIAAMGTKPESSNSQQSGLNEEFRSREST